jgi:hypothetical protein
VTEPATGFAARERTEPRRGGKGPTPATPPDHRENKEGGRHLSSKSAAGDHDKTQTEREKRIVQLTDWLPPDFSAVSQYAIAIAEGRAGNGADVVIVGLGSSARLPERREIGSGCVSIICVESARFDRESWLRRLLWTALTNLRLVRRAWSHMLRADEIRFTGSPPFLLHYLSFINLFLRKRLTYRITDFYPECIMAALRHRSRSLEWLLAFTNFLRRRIDVIEVIGRDMERRLAAYGIDPKRISFSPDLSPVEITSRTAPIARPAELEGRKTILYSGNWGVAHDIDTFLDGYRRHHREGKGSVILWLNATGSGAEELDRRLRREGLPFHRQKLVPLERLPNLLVTPDAHLVTLRPEFMGLVLPSKIYGCIASKRPVLFIGPEGSDVHRLCSEQTEPPYRRVEVGDAAGVESALAAIGELAIFAREPVRQAENAAPRPDLR